MAYENFKEKHGSRSDTQMDIHHYGINILNKKKQKYDTREKRMPTPIRALSDRLIIISGTLKTQLVSV